MFSGIIEEVGTVAKIIESKDGQRLEINAKLVLDGVKLGESISVMGVCLTVIEFTGVSFAVEATFETLRRTTLAQLAAGSPVNLERALKLNDRLGGHLVTGHVDALATVSKIASEGFSKVVTFELEAQLAPFFVGKGSVAVDGISLTVVDFAENEGHDSFTFRVALIPHTMDVTTLGKIKVGDRVNIETDVVARYVARWLAPSLGLNLNNLQAKMPFLAERS